MYLIKKLSILMATKDNSISPFDSIELINLFLEYYNNAYETYGSLFENINLKDKTSTNHKMEMFYQYMHEHSTLDDIDVYDKDTFKTNNSNDNDIFCLVVEKKLNYFSYSFISLLYTILKYKKKDNSVEWYIVKT